MNIGKRVRDSGIYALAMIALASLTLGATAIGAASAQTGDAAKLEGDRISTSQGELVIKPLNHATFVMSWQGKMLYVDPVGGAERFEGLPAPDLILITHEHKDHLNADTLKAIDNGSAPLVTPQSVHDQLPEELAKRTTVMNNGDSTTVAGIPLQAIPAYNTTPERLKYHPKGRDNGYILTLGDQRVYIAGDTEDTPEMRALSDVDVAFVPMNLPFTMTVEQAASAVREFKPGIVYPYHSRGSDVDAFAKLVGSDSGVDVRIRDWY